MTQPSDPAVGIARCNACGADFQSGEPFCGQCGEPISCLTCGQAFEEGTRFCPSCGRPKTTDFMSSGGDQTEATSVWDLVQAKLRRATLGEFEIKGEIGRGGMAAVYLAHEVALNRKVAIKVMSPALLMGTGMAARFRQEAITVANLNHQNIITIHAVRQFEDLQYFVMQFVEGCSLETIVKQSGPLSIPIVRALLFQVGSALAHAHHQGVVHRDIKPGNILTGMRGQALVTDFGIAKVLESPSNTQTGTVVGTPAYMSPEQCRIGEVTWRSDQYSLGIVAYEMVAGKVPFDGPTLAVLNAQVHEPVPRLTDVRPDCPEDLADAIGRMLEKNPADRFDDMSVALRDLGALPLSLGDPTYQDLAALVDTHHVQASVPTTPVSPLMRRTPDGVTVVSSEIAEADTTPIPSAVPQATLEAAAAAAATVDMSTPTTKASAAPPAPTMVAGGAHRPHRKWRVRGTMVAVALAGAAVAAWQFLPWEGVGATPAPAPPVDPVASITLPVDVSTMSVGESTTLSATVTDRGGATLTEQPLTWTSTDPAVASVDGEGRVEAAGIGTAFILVATGDHRDSTRMIVSAPMAPAQPREARVSVARVSVAPSELTLDIGGSKRLAATARDGSGRALTGRSARWASADASIAKVDNRGTVTGISAGTTAIRVTVEGKTRTVSVTVNPEPAVATTVRSLTDAVTLEVGENVLVSATVNDQRGDAMEMTVTWSSRDPDLISVASNGAARALSTGTTWLVAGYAGMADSLRATIVLPTEQQFQAAVEGFLAALNAHDLESLRELFQPANEGQRKRIAKLMDKVEGGQWDLKADTKPSGLSSRIDGNRATVDFTVELRWKNAFGGRKREKVTFIAIFIRDGAEWRMSRVQTAAGTKL